ncbi:MAG: LamG domain-containing protein [Deltaproteobacteria bacterium]|nr:LamG domain-containing protein [Deltaproteobacteria bacterium]
MTVDPNRRISARGTRALLAIALAALLAGCGDYSGGNQQSPPNFDLTGPGVSPGLSDSINVVTFEATVYPMLREYCAECHDGGGRGSPAIAHPSPVSAHQAAMTTNKINLSVPPSSRVVRRLAGDFHHCWSNCIADGAAMLAAVQAWGQAIELAGGSLDAGISVEALSSSELSLADGTEDEVEGRYRRNLLAFYDFKEGSGNVAHDTSGIAPAVDLQLEDVDWMSSYGIEINEGGAAIAGRDASRRLYESIAQPGTGADHYTIEAWVAPENIVQEGPSVIVSYSNNNSRNFTLGQVQYTYDFRGRSMAADIRNSGSPSLRTYNADEDAQATLQHVVLTYDQYLGRRIYVNGVFTDDFDENGPGRLWTWDPNHRLMLGSDTGGDNPWQGQFRMVAIYNEALTPELVQQNYLAGVGRRVSIDFDVSQWLGAESEIEMSVVEFDDNSYLFCQPTLNTDSAGIRVRDLRISVNGVTSLAGQAFRTMNRVTAASNDQLSRQCSIVEKQLGPVDDRFTLVFEQLGEYSDREEEPVLTEPPDNSVADPLPRIGVRDFRRIADSMAALVGVSPADYPFDNQPEFQTVSLDLAQSLPAGHDARSFVSSHQVGIAKLSLEYCDEMVDDPSLRDDFFGIDPIFSWNAMPSAAFDSAAKRSFVIDALIAQMTPGDLTTQPSRASLQDILDRLLIGLPNDCGGTGQPACDPTFTQSSVKGACAALLSSAAITLH